MKRYSNQWYEQQFGDPDRLLRQISADSGGDTPDQAGIHITKISKDSVFSKIGLIPGDIIRDIDGQLVNTIEEFINLLHKANIGKTIVRIERYNRDNMIDPIYIELDTPAMLRPVE